MSSLILLLTFISTKYCQEETLLLEPSKDQRYFQKVLTKNGNFALNVSAELQCNVMLSGNTNNEHPIRYYMLTITDKIKQLYPKDLKITTCCSIDRSNKQQMYQSTFDKAFNEYWSSQSTTNDIIFHKHDAKQNEKQTASQLWCDYCDCDNKQSNNSVNVTFNDIAYFYEGYSCDGSVFCTQNDSLDTVLYILSQKKSIVKLLSVEDDSPSAICENSEKSVIDLLSYDEGTYIIAVGGYGNETGSYQISLQCGTLDHRRGGPTATHSETKWVAWKMIIIIFTLFMLCCTVWYYYQVHHFRKKQIDQFDRFLVDYKLDKYENKLKKELSWMIEVYHLDDEELSEISQLCGLNDTDENIFINACNDYKNGDYPVDIRMVLDEVKPSTNRGSIKYSEVNTHISSDSDFSEELKTEQEEVKTATNVLKKYNTSKIFATLPRLGTLISYHSVIRRIGVEETRANLRLKDGEDSIQRVVNHVISFCNDNAGLDIYQVLAARSVDDISLQPTIFYPLKALGCESCCKVRARRCSCMHISHYHSALFMSFVVCLLQTLGFTITVLALSMQHLNPDYSVHATCSMRVSHWNKPVTLLYKILAFLWSFYITFNITQKMSSVKSDGLYKTFTVLEHDEVNKITCVDFTIVRWGQLINYYTGAFAVIGCYFVIYATDSSEEPAIDMILNSLALFFMLEADNIVVDFKDYQAVLRIFTQYSEQYKVDRNFYKNEISEHNKGCCNICCKNCCDIFHSCPDVFGNTVTILLYVIGSCAPFAIFLCW